MDTKRINTASQKKIEHLLVIRLSAMGDVAMTVPVLLACIRRYPKLKITVLTKSFFAPMFAQIENVTVFEAQVKEKHKGVFGLWTLYKGLSAQNVDAVADLHNVLRSKILKRYFKFGGVPFVQVDKARAEKKALTSASNKVFRPLKPMYDRYADVFRTLGFPFELREDTFLSKEKLSEKTKELLGEFLKPYVGIAPFAAFEGKRYPLRLMEKVIEKLDNTKKYKILLFGGGAEETRQLSTIESQFPSCVNIAGRLSFPEELALISNLNVMLSMDSGNGHLAAMYGIPVITLWGVTHPYAGFYPFGQNADTALLSDRNQFPLIPTSIYGNKIPEGYENVMDTITPEAVAAKLLEVLN